MKKIYLAVFLACSVGGAAQAQISEGGIPWSMSLQNEALTSQQIARVDLAAPDYEQYRQQDLEDAISGVAKPYRIAAGVQTSLNVLNLGTFSYLDNGNAIVRLQLTIPNADAIAFDYSSFELPDGVRVYISNSNGRHIIGAYTSSNNVEKGAFATEMVQGGEVVVELDIEKRVKLSDIHLNINNCWAYYRGTEMVDRFASLGSVEARPTAGESSSCNINSFCPQANGYEIQRSAVAKLEIGGGVCSGAMINNTAGDCKKYYLTASHCEQTNSFDETGSAFSTMRFSFEYEYPNCDGTGSMMALTRIGSKFRARSYYPSFPIVTGGSSPLVGDFLLLELNETPPADAYLAGWNRAAFLPELLTDPDEKYISFHHPSGDVKKVSYGYGISPTGTFNQTTVPSTHWFIAFEPSDGGGMEGGSSGSPIFDGKGRIVGDLSGGSNPDMGDCENAFGEQMGRAGLYSKISYNWENSFDGSRDGFGSKYRLKEWLNPTGSTSFTVDPAIFPCTPTSTNDLNSELDKSILVFPNPSSGKAQAQFNFSSPKDIQFDIVDIAGRTISSFQLKSVRSETVSFDISHVPDGIYLVNFNSGNFRSSKKLVIAHQ